MLTNFSVKTISFQRLTLHFQLNKITFQRIHKFQITFWMFFFAEQTNFRDLQAMRTRMFYKTLRIPALLLGRIFQNIGRFFIRPAQAWCDFKIIISVALYRERDFKIGHSVFCCFGKKYMRWESSVISESKP